MEPTNKKQQVFPSLDGNTEDRKLAFFMAASHQMKGPIATIQWCLRSLTEFSTEMPPSAQKLVGSALGQADTVSRLITDLLHLVRLEAGERPELTRVDVASVVRAVVDRYQEPTHQKGVHLQLDPLEAVPQVLAEPVLLEQAVVNLIDNAVKYTGEGGSVTVNLSFSDGSVKLRVSDEGIGIPELEQQRIFTEFFRGEEARSVAGGSGLGLVLTKQIVESFGGSINLESELHKGTVVEISLPA